MATTGTAIRGLEPRRGGTKVTFPMKLHALLEDQEQQRQQQQASATEPDTNDDENDTRVIGWLPHGRAFCIYDRHRFWTELMPLYFEHQTEFSSFQRQLNIYGFLRLPNTNNTHHRLNTRCQPPNNPASPTHATTTPTHASSPLYCYYHELFLRGRGATTIPRPTRARHAVRRSYDPDTQPRFERFPPSFGPVANATLPSSSSPPGAASVSSTAVAPPTLESRRLCRGLDQQPSVVSYTNASSLVEAALGWQHPGWQQQQQQSSSLLSLFGSGGGNDLVRLPPAAGMIPFRETATNRTAAADAVSGLWRSSSMEDAAVTTAMLLVNAARYPQVTAQLALIQQQQQQLTPLSTSSSMMGMPPPSGGWDLVSALLQNNTSNCSSSHWGGGLDSTNHHHFAAAMGRAGNGFLMVPNPQNNDINNIYRLHVAAAAAAAPPPMAFERMAWTPTRTRNPYTSGGGGIVGPSGGAAVPETALSPVVDSSSTTVVNSLLTSLLASSSSSSSFYKQYQ